jgi:ubiquinone/menaquinone biosynthesis C-methylase UbiE
MSSAFDLNAARFERHRTLPSGVPEAIREAVWDSTGSGSSARVLDLGAGSGRIGRAFVEAGDSYVGVDFSLSMLNEFRARSSSAHLVHADGGQLPFPDCSFELVLLMQVLSGTHNWRDLLGEALRVIVPGGFVVVGHTVTPAAGVDAQMKKQLARTLEQTGVAPHASEKTREQSLEWLRSCSSRSLQSTAASWTALRTPREFLERHRSGARFSALPPAVQEEALRKLGAWAEKTWGSLDKDFPEEHTFELYIFEIASLNELGNKRSKN